MEAGLTSATINYAVIHELVKVQHKKIQNSRIINNALDSTDDAVIKTVDDVVKVYGTKSNSAHYGTFKTGQGRGDFPDAFEKYTRKPSVTESEFIELTKEAMKRLYERASGSTASSGGYLLFADYKNSTGRYFLIAMIKLKPGITLSKNLTPEELMHLDLARLNQAARVNFSRLDAYLNAEPKDRFELSNYLSFVSPSSTKTASGYFVTALGCDQGTASSQATTTLINESKKFFRENADLAPKGKAFNADLMAFLEEKAKEQKSVKLVEIEGIVRRFIPSSMSEEADGLVETLLAHLNGEECAVPVEFPVSKSAVHKLTHIRGKTASWDISFDKTALGTSADADIYYNLQNGQIILNNVPDELKVAMQAALLIDTER